MIDLEFASNSSETTEEWMVYSWNMIGYQVMNCKAWFLSSLLNFTGFSNNSVVSLASSKGDQCVFLNYKIIVSSCKFISVFVVIINAQKVSSASSHLIQL